MPSTTLFQIQLVVLKGGLTAETATGYASGYANARGLPDAVFLAYNWAGVLCIISRPY